MTKKEMLRVLSDGHTIIKVEYAKKVCERAGVPFNEKVLVQRWTSDQSEKNPKGLQMAPGKENTEGVYTLELSHYVAKELGVDDKAAYCIGRGFQAQSYADQVDKVVK